MKRLFYLALVVYALSCCSWATTATCGDTTIESSDDAGADLNYAEANSCTTPGYATTVTDCKVYVGTTYSGKHFECAIYANKTNSPCNVTNCPGALVCSSSSTAAGSANQWLTISMTGCGTLTASTQYWVAVNDDGGSLHINFAGAKTDYYVIASYNTWPNPFGTASTNAGATISMYLDLASISAVVRHRASVNNQ